MQQPPRKRHRVESGNNTLDSEDSVSIKGHRPTPKQRISHACDRCRSRRAKCDGIQPTCVTCAAAGASCTYGTHTKKRGLPTGYVRLLELLWALVFESIPGAEDATLQLLRSASVVVGEAGVSLLCNSNGPNRDREELLPHDTWARSKVREAIDDRVLKIDAGTGGGSDVESKRRIIWEGIPLPTGYHIGQAAASPPNDQIARPLHHVDSSMTSRASPNSAQMELPDDAWTQVGSFLDYSYTWFPVVPKHDIVRLLSKQQDGSACTSSEMALLWSSLTVSCSMRLEPDQSLVAAYYAAAMAMLDNDDGEPSIDHVAAILLLGLSKMELYHWKDAYLLVGRAARLVHYMYNTTLHPDTKLNRAYLGAFVLDTLLSSYLGVPPSLSRGHIMSALSAYDYDGPEEWDPGSWDLDGSGRRQCPVRVLSIFGQLVKLMIVLNEAMVYEFQTPSAADILKEWVDQLPKHCSLEERSDILTPPLANLHMVYRSVNACVSASLSDDGYMAGARNPVPDAKYTRTFGTFASKSMLQICQKLSTLSKKTPEQTRTDISVDPFHDQDIICSSVHWESSHAFSEEAMARSEDPQRDVNTTVPSNLLQSQGQFLPPSINSPSFVIDHSLQELYPHSDNVRCQHVDDDAETMQTILEDILAQEAGNGPFSSSFMYDLGFFGEDTLPPT